MEACDCSALSSRCERCIANIVRTLSGVAQSRGWTAAPKIAGAALGTRWRTTRDEALVRVRECVADLASGDERLFEAFAELAGHGAARRFREWADREKR